MTTTFTMPPATNQKPIGDFLEEDVFPRLTAEAVFTHPAHQFQKSRDKWRGGCPWHESKSGTSFYITPSTLRWRCSACDIGGHVLEYRDRLNGGSGRPRGEDFVVAAREAADLAGVPFPERDLSPEEQERARAESVRRSILQEVIDIAQVRYWSDIGQDARLYMEWERGFTTAEQQNLEFGLCPPISELRHVLLDHGFSDADIRGSAVTQTGHGCLEGYIVIPWNDERGRRLTLYGRWPGEPPTGKPKTTALAGEGSKRSPLYFDRARQARHVQISVVEGVLDAAMAQVRGDTSVVACVGAQLSHKQVATLQRARIESVVICLDPDSAGEKGIMSCIESLDGAGITAYVAPTLPDSLDPDQFIDRNGIDAWREHLNHAIHAYKHKARQILTTSHNGAGWTDANKAAALKAARSFADAPARSQRLDDLRMFFWPELEIVLGKVPEAESDYSAYSAYSAYRNPDNEEFYSADRDSSEDWSEPIPLHDGEVPPFPVTSLPLWLREWAIAEAQTTQTPIDLPALLGLAAVSTSIARKVRVQPQPGWSEPVNLFGVVVLPPGSRKSAVFTDATAVIEEVEAERAAQAKHEIDMAELKRRTLETELQKLIKLAAGETGDARLRADADVMELGTRLAQVVVPELPRLIVDDCSPERLATLLSTQAGRIAVLSPEGDVFEIMSGKYSSGVPNFGVFLKGHAGDSVRVDRVGRAPELVRNPAITMLLTIQPEVLHGLVDRPGFRGRGLLGRFLYALPVNTVGQRVVRPAAVPEYVRATYDQRIRQLIDLEMPVDQAGIAQPYILTLTTEAETIFDAFVAELEPQLGEFGTLAHIADWAGKLAGLVARIAGLLHVAGSVKSGAALPLKIDAVTISAAVEIGRYATAQARVAFAHMGADPAVANAIYILRWLQRIGSRDRVSRRDIFNAGRARFKKVENLDPALQLLIAHQYLREAPREDRPGPGRKPSQVFEIHPDLYTQNTQYTQNSDLPTGEEGDDDGDPF